MTALLTGLVVVAFASPFLQAETEPSKPAYVAYCSIFNQNFAEIRRYPGVLCIFLKSGQFLSAERQPLVTFYSADGKELWKKPLHLHHQAKLNSQGHFLILTSEFSQLQGKKVRSDQVVLMDQSGALVQNWSFIDHRQEIAALLAKAGSPKRSWIEKTDWFHVAYPKVHFESSHINSVSEIEDNLSAGKIQAFAKGNYLVNTADGYLFVLSSDFKSILWFQDYRIQYRIEMLHDVQVLPNGHLLAYANAMLMPRDAVRDAPRKHQGDRRHSFLVEIDPTQVGKDSIVWQYGQGSHQRFFSGYCGGVQLLKSGEVLFSELVDHDLGERFKESRVKVIEKNGTLKADVAFHINGKDIKLQEIKEIDVTDFLKNNHSPF